LDDTVPPGAGVEYLNVVDPGQAGSAGWLLQNHLIHPAMELGAGASYAVTFDASSYGGGNLEYFITTGGFTTRPTGGTVVSPALGNTQYDDNDLEGRPGGPASPATAGSPPPNGSGTFSLGLGFGRIVWHTGMPDLAQGTDECGPTSAANSMEWLDGQEGIVLPEDCDTTTELRETLKDADHMRTNLGARGTIDSNFIKGKLQLISDKDLPITVEFQDNSLGNQTQVGKTALKKGNKPTFDWIFAQMKKGQDVEMGMTWDAGGGHWVTLVGAYEFFGVQCLAFKDPDDKKSQTKRCCLGTTESATFPGFPECEGEASNTIDIVVAESPMVPVPALRPETVAVVIMVVAAGGLAWGARRRV
jgi:hypothetical protein